MSPPLAVGEKDREGSWHEPPQLRMYSSVSSVSLVSTSLSAKKTRGSGVDTANKVCRACIKHQRDLYAQCALYQEVR